MKMAGRLVFLILAAAGAIIFISLFIRAELKQAAIPAGQGGQEEIRGPAGANLSHASAVAAAGGFSAESQGIVIVGAAPVEKRAPEGKGEEPVDILQPQVYIPSGSGPGKAVSGEAQSDEPAVPAGVVINKEPTEKEKESMTSKGTIIF